MIPGMFDYEFTDSEEEFRSPTPSPTRGRGASQPINNRRSTSPLDLSNKRSNSSHRHRSPVNFSDNRSKSSPQHRSPLREKHRRVRSPSPANKRDRRHSPIKNDHHQHHRSPLREKHRRVRSPSPADKRDQRHSPINNDHHQNHRSRSFGLPLPRLPSQTPFILAENVNFQIWKKILVNELTGYGLENVLNEDKPDPKILGWTNAYILQRIGDQYKPDIIDCATPKLMIESLEGLAQPILPQARFTVMRQFQSIKMEDNESVRAFIAKFGNLHRKALLYDKNIRKTEVIDNFLAAIKSRYPDVVTQYHSKTNANLEDLKTLLAGAEAEVVEARDRSDGDKTAAHTFTANNTFKQNKSRKRPYTSSNTPKVKYCTRCGKNNHSWYECRNPRWLCYGCNKLVDDHQGWNCPSKSHNQSRSNNTYNQQRYKWEAPKFRENNQRHGKKETPQFKNAPRPKPKSDTKTFPTAHFAANDDDITDSNIW